MKMQGCSSGISIYPGRWGRRGAVAAICLSLIFVFASLAAAEDCQCVICHGPDGPHSGGFPGCTACHGNPPISNQPGEDGLVRYPSVTGATSAGAHQKHAAPDGYNFDCQTCHFNGMPVTLIADNGEFQMGFDYLGQGGGAYDGRLLPEQYTYVGTKGTVITTNGTMTCTSLYCHSDGTSLSTGLVASGTSPSWVTAGPLACNGCHGYPPQYAQDQPKSNSHVIHIEQLQQYPSFSCGTCHAATTTDGLSISNPANHVNMRYDVSPGPDAYFDYVYDRGGGKCLNISCHGGGHPGWSNVWGGVTLNVGISATPGAGCYQVDFAGSATGGTGPYSYFWEFGDDTTGTGASVSHAYAGSGPYYPKLTVTDSLNHTGSRTTQVTPSPANAFPVAHKSVSVSGKTVTLIDLSYDADYNQCGHSGPGSVMINWGDTSSTTQSVNLTDSPSNVQFAHTYTCSGTCKFTIQHSVTDNSGAGPVRSSNVEVTVPTALSIGGRVIHADGAPFPGVTITLRLYPSNAYMGTTTTDANGQYVFANRSANYCYNVTPTKYTAPTATFSPASLQNICTSTSNANFTGTP